MAFARSLVKCALLAAFVSLSLGNKKVSEIGVEGESVLMTCDLPKADPPIVEWKDWVNNPGRTAMEIADKDGNINPSHPYKDNFEVDIVKHQLTIKKFKKEDAGNYICESKVNASTTLVKTIILNFVGTLDCAGKTDLKENDKSDLICEVAYQGSQLPRPEWLSPDVSEGLDYETRDELLVARQAVVFTAKPDMNNAKFTCRITVGEQVLKKTCDKTLSVLYAVNAVEIEPEQAQYHAGDKVKCTANGNPPPKVMWKPAVKGAETGEGYSVMTVPAPTEEDPKEVTYTCSASSHIGGKVEIVDKSITFSILGTKQPKPDVDKEPKPSTGGAGVAGLVVGLIVGLLILVVIIVAVVCVLRGRRSKQPKGSKPVPTTDTEYGPEMDGKA